MWQGKIVSSYGLITHVVYFAATLSHGKFIRIMAEGVELQLNVFLELLWGMPFLLLEFKFQLMTVHRNICT
jgi:hypothetical protein